VLADVRQQESKKFKHEAHEAHEEESGNQRDSHNKLSILLGHNSGTLVQAQQATRCSDNLNGQSSHSTPETVTSNVSPPV
jgi:hypothetical protein